MPAPAAALSELSRWQQLNPKMVHWSLTQFLNFEQAQREMFPQRQYPPWEPRQLQVPQPQSQSQPQSQPSQQQQQPQELQPMIRIVPASVRNLHATPNVYQGSAAPQQQQTSR